MPSPARSYTLIRTLGGNPDQLLARGSFRDINAQFVAAAGSVSAEDYVPVEIEIVRNWAEYQEGGEAVPRIVIRGSEPYIETWILNVAAVQSLAPVEVGS